MSETVSKVDELLEKAKGTMQSCVLCGVDKNGSITIQSSVGNVPFMHWMLNSAVFELGIFQKQNTLAEDEKAPESDIDAEAPKA
jgi:hypothetical protein